MNEHLSFLCNWVSAPRRVAAITPSSRSLATLITRGVSLEDAPVIELGAGTGVFTRRLIERGIPQEKIALIESGENFARNLQQEFPATRVFCMDAARLGDIALFDGEDAGAVVSGLPLLSMPPLQVARIVRGAFARLRPGGAFYQFTYGPRCPIPQAILDRLGLRANYVGGTLANLPPAAVFRISCMSAHHQQAH
jgi:phospholipid N-methyltransferase